MCGLTGYSSKASANTDKLALLMFHNSVKRGEDNTGYYIPEEGVKKDNIKAEEFLAKNPISKCHTFIGHVRKSSVGGKMAENSHPFEEENLVLAHNGTLTGYMALANSRGIAHTDYKVDSQVLAKALDQDSKEGDDFKTLNEFEGPAALLFADKRQKNVLYAYTNGQRPLFYGFVDQSMYISSTKESLQVIQAIEIEEFPKCVLHTIKLGKIVAKKEYQEKKSVTTYGSSWRGTDYYDDDSFSDYRSRVAANNNNITTNCRISNITIKDNEHARKLALKAPIADAFVDMWVKCNHPFNGKYNHQDVHVKKDSWYLCNDACLNNFDIKLQKDESKEDVTATKYLFDYDLLEFQDYGFIMKNLNKTSSKETLFTEGDIVEIADFDDKKKIVSVYHKDTNTVFELSTKYIRTITKEERELLENKAVEIVNENLNSNLPVIIKPEAEVTDEKIEDCEILDEVKSELNPDEALASYILDILTDSFDDILELCDQHTSSEKMQLKISEFKETLDEAYNFNMVKSQMEDDTK